MLKLQNCIDTSMIVPSEGRVGAVKRRERLAVYKKTSLKRPEVFLKNLLLKYLSAEETNQMMIIVGGVPVRDTEMLRRFMGFSLKLRQYIDDIAIIFETYIDKFSKQVDIEKLTIGPRRSKEEFLEATTKLNELEGRVGVRINDYETIEVPTTLYATANGNDLTLDTTDRKSIWFTDVGNFTNSYTYFANPSW